MDSDSIVIHNWPKLEQLSDGRWKTIWNIIGSLVIRIKVIFLIKQHIITFSVFSDNLYNCSNPLPS